MVSMWGSCVRCLMGCIGVSCFIAGIVSLSFSSKQIHEHKVQAYLQVLDAWKPVLEQFKGLLVTVQAGNSSMVLPVNTERETVLETPEGPELPAYEALSYRARAIPEGFLPSARLDNLRSVSPKEEWGTTVSFTFHLGGVALETIEVPLVTAVGHHEAAGAYNHCRVQKGVQMAGLCWVYKRLERLCVQVAPNGWVGETRKWELSPRISSQNKSYGCDYAGGNWDAAVYSIVPATWGHLGTWNAGVVRFTELDVQVVSSADPYLSVLELTGGTLTFGMTQEEELVLGFVLLFMGIVLMGQSFCVLCLAWRKSRQRRSHMPGRRRPPPVRLRNASEPDPEWVGMKYMVDAPAEG